MNHHNSHRSYRSLPGQWLIHLQLKFGWWSHDTASKVMFSANPISAATPAFSMRAIPTLRLPPHPASPFLGPDMRTARARALGVIKAQGLDADADLDASRTGLEYSHADGHATNAKPTSNTLFRAVPTHSAHRSAQDAEPIDIVRFGLSVTKASVSKFAVERNKCRTKFKDAVRRVLVEARKEGRVAPVLRGECYVCGGWGEVQDEEASWE